MPAPQIHALNPARVRKARSPTHTETAQNAVLNQDRVPGWKPRSRVPSDAPPRIGA